jgi:hypothetical protein
VPEIAAIGAPHLPPGGAIDRRVIDLIAGLAGWAGQDHLHGISLSAGTPMRLLVPPPGAEAAGTLKGVHY